MWINSVSHHSQLSSVSDRSRAETKRPSWFCWVYKKLFLPCRKLRLLNYLKLDKRLDLNLSHPPPVSEQHVTRAADARVVSFGWVGCSAWEMWGVLVLCRVWTVLSQQEETGCRLNKSTTSPRLCDRVKKYAAARKTASTEPLSRLQDPVVTTDVGVSWHQSSYPSDRAEVRTAAQFWIRQRSSWRFCSLCRQTNSHRFCPHGSDGQSLTDVFLFCGCFLSYRRQDGIISHFGIFKRSSWL